MPDTHFFDYLIFGGIATEFIIDLLDRSHAGILGGPALYAAGGLRCWKERIALVSHTAPKNQSRIEKLLLKHQIDHQGVQYQINNPPDRIFFGYISPEEVINENPVGFYASKKILFPKELIGYSKIESADLIQQKSIFLPEDIPTHYWDAQVALICRSDLRTQLQLSSMLLNASTKKLVIQSNPASMIMDNFEALPILLKDITAFITSTDQLLNLFRNRSTDIWEMAEYLTSLGCSQVIIHDGHFGHFLFDHYSRKRFHIPAYPVKMIDPTGMNETFCGGYLAGVKNYRDPLQAAIFGAVSASFKAEGSGAFYAAETIKELLDSRTLFERELVKTL